MAKILEAFGHGKGENYTEQSFTIFYHGTEPNNIPKILAKGLPKRSYLTPIRSQTLNWGEARLKVLLPKDWILYSGDWYETPTYEVFSMKPIPAKYIKSDTVKKIRTATKDEILKVLKARKTMEINELAEVARKNQPRSDRIIKHIFKTMDELVNEGKAKVHIDQQGMEELRWSYKPENKQ